MFIKIDANNDGGHSTQTGGVISDGWAFIPNDIVIPSSFPYVNIEVAEVFHPAVTSRATNEINGDLVEHEEVLLPEYTQVEVISMTEGERIEVEEPEIATQLDVIEAQVTYTAMMTGTLLEG